MKKTLTVVCLLCAAALAAAAGLQFGESGIELKHFRTNGVTMVKDGAGELEPVNWSVAGSSAIAKETEYLVQDFEMELGSRSRGNYRIVSPQCAFNQAQGELHSSSAVEITGDELTLTGIGYDLYWNNEAQSVTVVIRNAAHLVFKRGTIDAVKRQKTTRLP